MANIIVRNIDLGDFLQIHYGINRSNDDTFTTMVPTSPSKKKVLQKRPARLKPVVFFDQNKYQVWLWPTMSSSFSSGGVAIPLTTGKPCWQCRLKINGMAMPCPLKYITAETHPFETELFKKFLIEQNYDISEETDFEHIEGEGLFCSEECVKSYIFEQLSITHLPIYRKSLTLLSLLQQKLRGTNQPIKLAISWKMLQDWGGHLSPAEYKSMRGKREFLPTTKIKRPFMYASATYFQETHLKTA